MSDYPISVGVTVEDGQLDALETKINSLKTSTVTVNVKTNFINGNSKDINKAVKANVSTITKQVNKAVTKAPKAKGTSITDQLLNPGDTLKSVAKSVKDISKFGDNLNLGEVKLTLNKSIMSNLDDLKAKLNEIKALANSMGSIRLKVDNGINMANGTNTTSSSGGTKAPTTRQLITNLKKTVEAEGELNKQIRLGNLTSAQRVQLEKKRIALRNERNATTRKIKASGSSADEILANKAITESFAKSQKELQTAIENRDKYEKTFNSLNESLDKYKTIDKVAGTKSSNDDRVLSKQLGQGFEKRVSYLEDDLNKLSDLRKKMKTATGDDLKSLQASADLYLSHAKEQEKFLRNTNQFYKKDNTKYTKSAFVGLDLDTSSEQVQNAMNKMAGELANGKKYTSEYNAAAQKMNVTVERGSGVMEKYAIAYKNGPGNIESALTRVNQQVKPLSSYISDLGSKFKSLSQYLISNFGFQALQTGVTSGITAIKELDSAMTELKKTSTGTKQEYRDFTAQARIDAKEIGSTTTQITNSAADYTRLGNSLADASILAKTTGVLKNVSEFQSIDDATQAMISMMEAFDIDANKSMDLVDKMNLIGNNYAISTDGIATSLKTSASALVASGNDIDKSIALVTAANSVVQDPSQVGRGMRTIALRLRGTSAEVLEAEGEDTEGLVETTSKLQENIKSLTAVNGKAGVSILDINGNYRDTYDILKDISQVWKEIGEQDIKDGQNRQAALLEMMAGKNRSNILASILQNPDLLTNVYEDSTLNYKGSAQQELNTYLDSVEAKTTKIKESWAQLWQSEGNTSAMKNVLDMTNGVVQAIDFLGPGKTAAGVATAALGQVMGWGGINQQLVLN